MRFQFLSVRSDVGQYRIDPSLLPDLSEFDTTKPELQTPALPSEHVSIVSDGILGEEFGGCWTVVDRGERRPPGQKRYGVVSFDHQPARVIIRPDPWRAKNGAKITVDPSSPPVILSEGGPMTYEEACESARRMNEILEVHES